MAVTEILTDDYTGDEITYPYVSIRSVRVELSPSRFAWLGDGDIKTFKDEETLCKWLKERLADALDRAEEGEEY